MNHLATDNPSGTAAPTVIWGAKNIARAIGRTERAVFHMLETGTLPGAKKVAGRWCFAPAAFYAAIAA